METWWLQRVASKALSLAVSINVAFSKSCTCTHITNYDNMHKYVQNAFSKLIELSESLEWFPGDGIKKSTVAM